MSLPSRLASPVMVALIGRPLPYVVTPANFQLCEGVNGVVASEILSGGIKNRVCDLHGRRQIHVAGPYQVFTMSIEIGSGKSDSIHDFALNAETRLLDERSLEVVGESRFLR